MKKALTLVCNDNFVRMSKVCLYSFFKHNQWFDGDIIIIHDNGQECGLSNENKKFFMDTFPNVRFHCADYNEYRKSFEHYSDHLNKNLNSSFYKLEIFDFNEYDCIFQVDGDMLFMGSIEPLLEIKEDIAMCEERGIYEVNAIYISDLPNNNIKRADQYCNAGFIMLKNSILKQGLKQELLKLGETIDFNFRAPYSPLDKKWAEQDLLNIYFHDKDMFLLSNEYNMPKRNFFKGYCLDILNKVKILHYLADKPFIESIENNDYVKINNVWKEEEKKYLNIHE